MVTRKVLQISSLVRCTAGESRKAIGDYLINQ